MYGALLHNWQFFMMVELKSLLETHPNVAAEWHQTKNGDLTPDPKNILLLFEYADKSVSASVLEGTPNQYDILRENYEFLCEFSHPNFHSNQVAFDVDTSIPGFVFRHGQKMREREFELIGYLRISTPIFLFLYDQIPELLP